ncbi:MAG: hypothetical protein H0V53_08270 [Rubrobacter sp.]|jgi:hypothetical protein|nr:hypothetical protein [Rubrobacter sp.]
MTGLARIIKGATETRSGPRGQEPLMRSDFSFAMPGFLSGIASVLDISGNLRWYDYGGDGAEADFKALYSDYRIVGQDIEEAMRTYERQYTETSGVQKRLFDPDEVSHTT